MKNLTKVIIAGLLSTSALAAFADGAVASSGQNSFALKIRGGYAVNNLKNQESTGAKASSKNGLTFELASNYFVTSNIAIEGSVGYIASKWKAGTSELKAHIFPTALALQYHFMPDSLFKPYIGLGYGFEFVKLKSKTNDVAYKSGNVHGLVLQAGSDLTYNDSINFNFDVKYRLKRKIKSHVNNFKPKVSFTTIMAGVSFPF
jgi:outer membrane protein